MKELIKLSREKGFRSRDNLTGVVAAYWPMWLCELQKWMREEHRIFVAANIIIGSEEEEYNLSVVIKGVERYLSTGFNPIKYPTYEIALADGLKRELKRILPEDRKRKQKIASTEVVYQLISNHLMLTTNLPVERVVTLADETVQIIKPYLK